ncbi:MAG: RNA ligase partner protein [Candidatus Micrarchaeota archaeon]|nr:RNA ligase partner protein [Candidatus Micrarchaeota archaeon]MCX8154434.1 RNA ligase partner protein [Candidatus Micrarchaeota archaeon]
MRVVLDASVFGNPYIYTKFHQDRKNALLKMLLMMKERGIDVYITPSVRKEIMSMLDNENDIVEFDRYWKIQSPDLSYGISAFVVWEYVDDVRNKINRALRIAEEYVNKNTREESVREIREKFRQEIRHNLLDSTTDLEVVLLSKQIDAFILSLDYGLIKFADRLGCKRLNPEVIDQIFQDG